MKRVVVAVLLLALLGVVACGEENSGVPTAREGATASVEAGQPQRREPATVDPNRNAPAYEAHRAAMRAEEERSRVLANDRRRVFRGMSDARGDEAAFRAFMLKLKAQWRESDAERYARAASAFALRIRGGDMGLADHVGRALRREVALDALQLEDKIPATLEAELAVKLSSTVVGNAAHTRLEPAVEWRKRFAWHWVRAWSRLIEALGPEPQPVEVPAWCTGPLPGEPTPKTSGPAPPYLVDPVARGAYDQRLRRWFGALAERERRGRIKRMIDREVPSLRRGLVFFYQLEPYETEELRKLLSESSIPATEVSSILRDVGAHR